MHEQEKFQVTLNYLQLVIIEFPIILDDVGLMMMIKKFQISNKICLLHAKSKIILGFFFLNNWNLINFSNVLYAACE